MKNIFLIIDTQPCHPELVSGSDPSAQGARCRNKSGMTWGFTLAEVLITLGIIGIVATVTMPALISDYRKKVNETASMVFENRLEQALQQMNIAEDLTGHTSTADFLTALKKYMKIIKTCASNEREACFAPQINDLKVNELEFMGTKDWGTVVEAFVLQNGTTALIKYNTNCQSPGMAAKGRELRNCIAITYDTNGLKKPNTAGKDIGGNANFMIKLPSGLRITSGDVPFTPLNTCSKDSPYYRSNNTVCSNDYWAGAKKACKDLGLDLPKSWGSNLTVNYYNYCPGRTGGQNINGPRPPAD